MGVQAILLLLLSPSPPCPGVRDSGQASVPPSTTTHKGFDSPPGKGWEYSSPAHDPKFKAKHIVDIKISAGNRAVESSTPTPQISCQGLRSQGCRFILLLKSRPPGNEEEV